jgi:hypothetical protein
LARHWLTFLGHMKDSLWSIDISRCEPADLTIVCRDALFTGKIAASDIEAAIKGAQLTNNFAGILHTLGCVYAKVRKTKEARGVLGQAMDKINLDETDEDFWYAFGRIADQYGEKEIAMRIYGLAEKPRDAWMFQVRFVFSDYMAKKADGHFTHKSLCIWWTRWDSNPRPPHCERGITKAKTRRHNQLAF